MKICFWQKSYYGIFEKVERNFLPLKKSGRHLSRTPAACGFRWNSYVRKQYKERIEEAKQLRKVENYEVKETKVLEPTSITLNDVIEFLQNYKDESSLMVLQQQIESLQTEKETSFGAIISI